MTTTSSRPGRPSRVDVHPDRETIETELLEGKPVTALTAVHAVPERNLYRAKARLRAEVAVQAEQAHEVTLADFAARLVDIADHAHEVRVRADAREDDRLAMEAGKNERATLLDLRGGGIDSADTAKNLRNGEATVKALARLVPEYGPEFARRLAQGCRRYGATDDFTDALDDLALRLDQKEN